MHKQISWKVGGQQGEGIESTGEIFSTALNREGYYIYTYRHFSSRIKGGHTNNKIRMSIDPIYSISDDLDILVAFDQETIDVNYDELHENGVILADAKFNPEKPSNFKGTMYVLPFTHIAKELGTSLMKNMVAVGATACLMQLPMPGFENLVVETFKSKGEKVVDLNKQALILGYEALDEVIDRNDLMSLEKPNKDERLFMIGNDAMSLGALSSGARFMSAYPITPASEIMEFMIDKLPQLNGTVIQTEDEIAAATMAIGANYAGVRAFTASAGPGLSLMMESIGLSGMTETPLVIFNTQRGGPSTGLPTKQEQSDLNQMIYGTHGDIPKIVISPIHAEDAFYLAGEAFNLAEQYQCPVIVLSDLQLSLGKQTVHKLDQSKIKINRGQLTTEVDEEATQFKRYNVTDHGISNRVIPGVKGGIHHVTGVEHNEYGKPSEASDNRNEQMNKRMRKLDSFELSEPFHVNIDHNEAEILVIGFISTYGAIDEAISRVDAKVNHIQIRQLYPLPVDQLMRYVAKAQKVLIVEHNYRGQLTQLVKSETNIHDKLDTLTKYDGKPFKPKEIEEKINEMLGRVK